MGTPMIGLARRRRSGIFGVAAIRQSRCHCGNTDVSILTIKIGPLVVRIGAGCPVCLCLFLAHFFAPLITFRTLSLEGGGNGRQMAPLDDISGRQRRPDFFNDCKH
jgi:hypothetical protein